MKMYVLTATLEKLTTSIAIQARDNFSAKVLAVNKINANHIADKRYALGSLTLKDPDGKVVWEVGEEIKKGGD
jgi:hypothetical protein